MGDQRFTYKVFWSEEDGEWVATCDQQPYMSNLDADPVEALKGMIQLMQAVEKEEI